MANPTTLQNLTDQALDYADMTGSAFPNATRLTEYINKGLSALHDLLINADQDYFLTISTIPLIVGTETYSLPTDFYRGLKVFKVYSGRRYLVPMFNLSDIDGSLPGPIDAGNIELWYSPQLTRLVAPGDIVEAALPDGWEDYVALNAAIKLLNKEESDSTQRVSEKNEVEGRIIAMAQPRDSGGVKRVEDVDKRWRDYPLVDDVAIRNIMYRVMGQNIRIISKRYY